MYIDFHTHMDLYEEGLYPQQPDAPKLLCLSASVDIESWQKNLLLAKKNPAIIPLFGVHPSRAVQFENCQNIIDPYLSQSPIIAEIGLDKIWCDKKSFSAQMKIFDHILKHCAATGKFCLVHTKGAEKECLSMMEEYDLKNVIVHWYDGPVEIFEKMMANDWYFTFSPAVRYRSRIRKLLSFVPESRMLAETDNPGSDIWLGGQEDGPLLIKRVINDMAQSLAMDENELNSRLNRNSKRILEAAGIWLPDYEI